MSDSKPNDPERIILDGWGKAPTNQIVDAALSILGVSDDAVLRSKLEDDVPGMVEEHVAASEFLGFLKRLSA